VLSLGLHEYHGRHAAVFVGTNAGTRHRDVQSVPREAIRMPNIAVTPEQLQSVASQLNAGAANIESTLSQLASQVAPLQSEWQGVAQARFQELWAEWQRSSRGIQEALHGISQLTQQAGANYGDTEQAIASSFSR
jgi:early secretory antigenic target protein ESAT-6